MKTHSIDLDTAVSLQIRYFVLKLVNHQQTADSPDISSCKDINFDGGI
jgi:hypothetical protein